MVEPETKISDKAVVGVIDTTGLDPAAIRLAQKVTPQKLYRMNPQERARTLAITPESYDRNTEKLADFQFVQFASVMGLANHLEFINEVRDGQGWMNLDYYRKYGNELIDSVYGNPISSYDEILSAQFPTIAMRTEGVTFSKNLTDGAAAAVDDYKVIFSRVPGSTRLTGGDTVMASADVELKIKFSAPVDYTDLINDPNSMNQNTPVLGDGLPATKTVTVTFSDVYQRQGVVAPTAIIISDVFLDGPVTQQ